MKFKNDRQIVITPGKRKLRMGESGSEMQKGEQIDWKTADTSLLKFSLLYLVFQLVIVWVGNFIFSSSVEISRFVHSFFVEMDNVTPALAWLKVGYQSPVNGREFSQVFAIYFLLLALLCLYLIALCGLLLSRKFRKLQWHKIFSGNRYIILLIFPIGFWGIYDFYAGPAVSVRKYLGIFGTEFIDSMCVVLPGMQFLILGILAFCYAIGKNTLSESVPLSR